SGRSAFVGKVHAPRRNPMNKLIGRVAAFGFVASTVWATSAFAQSTEVKIAYALARDHPYSPAADGWEKYVTETTGGTFTFTLYPPSAQRGEREDIADLQLGTGGKAVVVTSAALSKYVAAIGVADTPPLFRDLSHAR